MIKRNFMTGLALLLPVVLTLLVVLFIINLLTGPFRGLTEELLYHSGMGEKGFLFFNGEEWVTILSKIFTLIGFVLLTMILGFAAQWLALHYFMNFAEWVFDQIPVVNRIYKASKEVVHTILGSKKENFGKVVLVNFPNKRSKSIGLLTREEKIQHPLNHKSLISVFVPAAPNPTMGFMLLYPVEEVQETDLTVEEALRIIISCGAMLGEEELDDLNLES